MSLDVRQYIGTDLPATDQLPPLSTTGLETLRSFGAGAARTLWDIRLRGQDRIPDGPAIIAPNHIATIDGPLAVLFTPHSWALAKSELFNSAVGGLLRAAGQISLARHYPDANALKMAVHVLRSGKRLVIFPEGRRGRGDMSQIKGGVAWLAMVTGAPVVPMAILGTRQAGESVKALPAPRSRIEIVYGGAVRTPVVGWPRRRAAIHQVRERIRRACAENVQFAEQITELSVPAQ